ncbi:MAG TPA: hypothetical protein VKY53_06680 [Marinobacter sp.]|nr:hypothetical protein [Marinobacter sp.]
MEPIRPDDDELIADEPFGAAEPRAAKPASAPPPQEPGKTGGRGGSWLLWALLLVLAAGAGASGYFQDQRIRALESQLEEADYWARQSKLALARFEGELSETGESLAERGASIEEQLSAATQRLDTADSEIRKLWGVANDRNRKRLDEHQSRLDTVDNKLADAEKRGAETRTQVEQLQSGFARSEQALRQELEKISEQVAGVDEQISKSVRRFQQEQKLTLDGLEGRISSLEKDLAASAGDAEVTALRNELAQLKTAVNAIDASRAQLTSRLVRLSDEVNQLRSQ